MTCFRLHSPALDTIDKKIAALKAERKLLVHEAASAKAKALCAEMRKRNKAK